MRFIITVETFWNDSIHIIARFSCHTILFIIDFFISYVIRASFISKQEIWYGLPSWSVSFDNLAAIRFFFLQRAFRTFGLLVLGFLVGTMSKQNCYEIIVKSGGNSWKRHKLNSSSQGTLEIISFRASKSAMRKIFNIQNFPW